jgi:hypothetical protein
MNELFYIVFAVLAAIAAFVLIYQRTGGDCIP